MLKWKHSNFTYNHCITTKEYLNVQHFEVTNYISQTTSNETE